MTSWRRSGVYALLVLGVLASAPVVAEAEPPTSFTFTPTFKDPDPGTRRWEKRGTGYVETLPSGRQNTFRFRKQGTVNKLTGVVLQKIEDPNFFVFVADASSKRKELWWWRDKGPWNFMGLMRNVIAPVRID